MLRHSYFVTRRFAVISNAERGFAGIRISQDIGPTRAVKDQYAAARRNALAATGIKRQADLWANCCVRKGDADTVVNIF